MKILLLCLFVTMMSCHKVVKEKQLTFNLNEAEKKALDLECAEINSTGDIFKLLAEIKSETKEALKIIEGENLSREEERVTRIAESINRKAEMVLNLSKPEWTHERWSYEASWVLNREDFNDLLGTHVKKGFEITNVQMQDIYFLGEKKNELLTNITIDKKYNKVTINYKNTGSSLELCQLHKTLMIFMKVDYRNIVNDNKRFFNLTLDY
jgi:hypothetical protein